MSQASDFGITFPYGATDGVYYYTPTPSKPKTALWLGNYHRGDDRAMPTGTSIRVNGMEIGLSGNTGASSGPHLHIGRFVNGKDTDPGYDGFIMQDATVYDTGYDPANGNYVRIVSHGILWVYLHLSKVLVTKGQAVVGTGGKGAGTIQSMSKDILTREEIIVTHRLAFFSDPPQTTIDYYLGKDLSTMLTDFVKASNRKDIENKLASASLSPEDVGVLVKILQKLVK